MRGQTTSTQTPATRICTICKQEKNLADFSRRAKGQYGHQSGCKLCIQANLSAYRKTPKGKAKYREYDRRHRETPGYRESHEAYRNTPKAQWNIYKKDAERNNRTFDFTLDEFERLFWQRPCHYCGELIKRAGVDRIDNGGDYTAANTVPCCTTCNLMKHKSTKVDFIAKCKQIAKRWGS